MTEAFANVADDVVHNSKYFAWSGPGWPTQAEEVARLHAIEQQAKAMRRSTTYREFEAALGQLHKLGMFPDGDLVFQAAQAAVRLETA
jgi:hypothetical protein